MGERNELRRIRELHGKTTKTLASELGVSRQYIYKVEKGERSPSHALMIRWIRALNPGLSIDAFFTDTLNAA